MKELIMLHRYGAIGGGVMAAVCEAAGRCGVDGMQALGGAALTICALCAVTASVLRERMG